MDYRSLNSIIKIDRRPLPLVKETRRSLSQASWLIKLDVNQVFHQISMAEEEECQLAFRTRYGLYEWNMVPFGLTGAPAIFQPYINWLLPEYLDDLCTAYIDDILFFTQDPQDDHRAKLRQMLRELQGDLSSEILKCRFEVEHTRCM